MQRLYRNTEPGRSDHSLLLVANERIDRLLEMEKEIKNSNKVKEKVVSSVAISPVSEQVVSSAVISPIAEDVSSVIISPVVEDMSPIVISPVIEENYEEQINTSTKFHSTKSPTIIAVSTDEVQYIKKNWTLEELESQLDTSKTRDLFTKLPKVN